MLYLGLSYPGLAYKENKGRAVAAGSFVIIFTTK
jgi:hypothetical protein